MMFRKPLGWILLVLVSLLCIVFIYFKGAEAFSFIDVKTTMDRAGSLRAADVLQKQLGIPLSHYKSTTIFGNDFDFQSYVEMKAGGKSVFQKLMKRDFYTSYTWEVRHFIEGQVHEASYYFTPLGQPYGFTEKLPETEKGTNLTIPEARALAEKMARTIWKTDLTPYTLVESSMEIVQSGRNDHTFVYERRDAQVKDATFRLKLVVSGNRLTCFQKYYDVPDRFWKEYEQMRSYNETIASVGSAFMFVLYILGSIIWIFLYLRKRQIIWKPALLWTAIIGVMGILNTLNSFPYLWLGYDTSLSSSSFISQQLISILVQTIADSILVFITFLAAEALTRHAFPNHVQFWKTWSRQAAPSREMLGKTIGGYLMIPIWIAYAVAFYLFTVNKLHWWQPASTISDPNILAAYVPWYSSIAMALHAGFWEESLFRAVPLASMAIIGTRLGKRNLFLGIGIILQAFIFGSMHANYAAQPAYARLVELIIPSILFALVYVRFGLFTGIIIHFVYDAVLMNMSAYFTQVPGIWAQRIIFILVVMIPIWIVHVRRLQARGWQLVPDTIRNAGWFAAEEKGESVPVEEATVPQELTTESTSVPVPSGKSPVLIYLLILLVALGLMNMRLGYHGIFSKLKLSPKEAIAKTRQALKDDYHYNLAPDFQAFPEKYNADEKMKLFMANYGTKEQVHKLVDQGYLNFDSIIIKFKRFKGTLTQRNENYYVALDQTGHVSHVSHGIAEDVAGDSLTEAEAGIMAKQAIQTRLHCDPATLKIVKIDPKKLPHRMDWTFTFQDTLRYPLSKGQGRINVAIHGNEIAYVSRYIQVPEEWSRYYDNQNTKQLSFRLLFIVLLVLAIFGALVFSIIRWSKRRFDLKRAGTIFVLFVLSSLGVEALAFHYNMGGYSTIEPFTNQISVDIIMTIIKTVFLSGAVAVLYGAFGIWQRERSLQPARHKLSVMLTTILIALVALFQSQVGAKFEPLFWFKLPNFHASLMTLPWLSILLSRIKLLVEGLIVLEILFFLVSQITAQGRKRRFLEPLVFLFTGICITMIAGHMILPLQLHYSLWMGLVYALVLYITYLQFMTVTVCTWIRGLLLLGVITLYSGIFTSAMYQAGMNYGIAGTIFLLISLPSFLRKQS